ncbi:MAG TPA: lantibiotic dehydratase [Myxococcales bacterium]|nr:lantibiotic dehydratase [Myxococcales bacterium]
MAPRPAGFFVLRTPLLPVERARALGEGLRARAAYESGGDLEAALAQDRALLNQRFQAACADPIIREALFLASPALEGSLDQLRGDPGGERRWKVELSVSKYLSRMSARAAPFGLFAGNTVGRCGDATDLRLPPVPEGRRRARLDAEYLWELTERVGRDPGFRRTLTYQPNSSLSEISGTIRYVETRNDEQAGRVYHLVEVEPSPHLRAALDRAAGGAGLEALAAAVAEADPDVGPAEAEEYVLELIDSQVLVSDFTPWLTGEPPSPRIARELCARPSHAWIGSALQQVDRGLVELDAAALGEPPARYRALAAALEALPAPAKLERLFQVDLVKEAPGASLGRAVMAELERAISLVRRITPCDDWPGLVEFRRAFTERYGDREVPLLEALDDEAGIGFERARDPSQFAPLLEDLAFEHRRRPASPAWSPRATVLLGLVHRAVRTGAMELSLEEPDLRALEVKDRFPPPTSFYARATLAAESGAAADRGDFDLHFRFIYGPPGGVLLGRFCHGDPALEALMRADAAAEEAQEPDAIFAEIVHLPDGRMGNVINRPVLRQAEIPYLGMPGGPPEHRIPLSDLLVSVAGHSIVLRSRSRGRRVLPRMMSAHNFFIPTCLPPYRFLGLLQLESADEPRWEWGPLASAPFLPRIRVGRVVLSLAKWTLPASQVDRVVDARGAARFREVQRLRDELRWPRRVALASERDELDTLEVDLDDVLSVEAFARALHRGAKASINEVFPSEDRLCALGPEGRFRHELVLPYTSGEAPPRPPLRVSSRAPAFVPGSEWLYARIYSGEVAADAVLAEHLAPLARRVVKRKDADRWFFIRYVDPATHLRLRLHGDPKKLAARALPELNQALEPLLERGLIWKVDLGTYEPEVDRYGGPAAIETCERIFHLDSEAVVDLLDAAGGDAGARWRLALLGMHQLLLDFGLAPEERVHLCRRARAALSSGVPRDMAMERQLAARYRKDREEIDALVGPGALEIAGLEDAAKILRRRSRLIARHVKKLRALEREGGLVSPFAGVVSSLLHMHANRMFHAFQPYQEMVLHDFIARAEESALARAGRPIPREQP